MTSKGGKIMPMALAILMCSASVLAVVPVPAVFACPFGQIFEYDGCVPSPLLYQWSSSSPTASTAPSTCIWEMPWGAVKLPCNIMNCQTMIFPQGYTPQSQPVHCSELTVTLNRLVNGAVKPASGYNVTVRAMLTCDGPGNTRGTVYVNVSMSAKTDTNGIASFRIPSTVGSSLSGSYANCDNLNPQGSAGDSGVEETDPNGIGVNIPWPAPGGISLWLHPITSTPSIPVRLGRLVFVL